jgi:hypothetical protein
MHPTDNGHTAPNRGAFAQVFGAERHNYSGLEPVKGPTAMTKTALFTIVATLTLTPAIAETDIESTIESADWLMPGCRELANDDFKSGFCAGTITTLRVLSDCGRFGVLHCAERSVALGFCIPPNVTNGQAVRAVVQYIDAQPARWHENFDMLAIEALRKAWPCQQQQNR